jgi:hypothetical protein
MRTGGTGEEKRGVGRGERGERKNEVASFL